MLGVITGEFRMLAVITSEIRMLGVITGEICMLTVITGEIRMLAVITSEIRMLVVITWRNSHVSSHNWRNLHVRSHVKLVKENCKDTKLSFFSVICRTDIKDATDTINTTNSHLENYCKQQIVRFIDNGNIKKSNLNPNRLYLHERGSSKVAKHLLDFIY